METNFFIKNRERLAAELSEESLTILFAGEAPPRSADETYDFVPNRNFYYLTGIDRPNIILAIKKNGGKTEEMLFIEENDPVMEKWVGRKLSEEEAKATSGIKTIHKLEKFTQTVHMALQHENFSSVYLNLELMSWDSA
ncbi:MAG TPA: aminopeptidase P N-terminal domain-containing protein, partial [Bacillales bacterium]|nr:aminopeptidase P N-terminal domain-containing protein [Bacillales bacterium]